MTETRDMKLGGRTFAVPALPIRINIKAYPLLRRLSNGGFVDDWFDAKSAIADEDMAALADVLFLCAVAADPALAREDFDALAASPGELMDALLVARFQSGGWLPAKEEDDDGVAEGEGQGAPKPPKSTSAKSSES